MELIPAIDIRAARVVRLERGDFSRETVYDPDPISVASRLVALGAKRLHVIDLDAARDGAEGNWRVIRRILQTVRGAAVQVGGGVRSVRRVTDVLDAGADRVVLGTVALEEPQVLREAASRFPGRIVLALDEREGHLRVRGWLADSMQAASEVARRFEEEPLAAILYTDISRDGTLAGPNVEAAEALARSTAHPVIVSGGIGSVDDLLRLARTRVIAGAVLGKALYSGRIDLARALGELSVC